MANRLARVFAGSGEARQPYVESTSLFPRVDIDATARKLRLTTRGHSRGEMDQPSESAVDFDEVERDIVSLVDGIAKEATEAFMHHNSQLIGRGRNLPFQESFQALRDVASRALGNFDAATSIGVDQLFLHRRAVVGIEQELREYREKHHIRRLPRHPLSRALTWGVILVILAIETVLNGTFLAKGNELGLLGGATQALVIAALNVGLGLFTGRVLAPYVARSGFVGQILGLFAIGCVIAANVGFNLLVAHYRLALAADDPTIAGTVAFNSWMAGPLALRDFDSWLLFLLGCTFFGIAAVDGWKMEDPYPTYGRLARRQEAILDDYIAEKEERLEEIESIRDESLESIRKSARELEKFKSEYRQILESKSQLPGLLQQYFGVLESAGNTLLEKYRDANRHARKTPAPLHFSRPWTLVRPVLVAPPAGERSFEEVEKEIGEALRDLDTHTRKIHDCYSEALKKYHRVEQLAPEDVANGPLGTTPA